MFSKGLPCIVLYHYNYCLCPIFFTFIINVLSPSFRVWIFLSTMEFWWWGPNPREVIVWLETSINEPKGCSENIPFSAWCILILTPNVSAYISKADFPDKFSSWIVLLVRCIKFKSLRWSTITWESQIRALVILPYNRGTNPGLDEWSWHTETPAHVLQSVYFLMDPNFFPFFSVASYLLFQAFIIHKEAHHLSSL